MSEQAVATETIASDFSSSVAGHLDQAKIDEAVSTLTEASAARYGANGSVMSMIFYMRFSVTVSGGKTFTGNAGSIGTPGGGALFGDVYTDDLQRLYRETRAFQYNCTPVYVYILFFDGSSNLLGHFQSGSVSTVIGTGGGSGSWQ